MVIEQDIRGERRFRRDDMFTPDSRLGFVKKESFQFFQALVQF